MQDLAGPGNWAMRLRGAIGWDLGLALKDRASDLSVLLLKIKSVVVHFQGKEI
jgi:hypothetical protein